MTGAGSGIGRFMSIKFAQLGATVICTDLNSETAEETANMIKCLFFVMFVFLLYCIYFICSTGERFHYCFRIFFYHNLRTGCCIPLFIKTKISYTFLRY